MRWAGNLSKEFVKDLGLVITPRVTWAYLVLHHSGEQLSLQLKDGVGGEHLSDPLPVRSDPQASRQLGRHGEYGGRESRI